MKTLRLCLAFGVLCGVYSSAPALAQTADTTSAWRYLPLEVGNVWEYQSDYYDCPQRCGPKEIRGYWRWTVTQDSIVESTLYFVLREEAFTPTGELEEEGVRNRLVRFDASLGRGAEHLDDGSLVPWPRDAFCRLDTAFYGTPDCGEYDGEGYYDEVIGGYEERVRIGGDQVITTAKGFLGLAITIAFAADIGFTYSGGGQDSFWEDNLVYARVRGIEYGDRIPVATEPSASEVPVLTLAVYPNPSRGGATVSFSLDVPQRVTLAVFDVLGRRVLTTDLGAQPTGEATHRLDAAGLPVGLYVVRLTGDAGTSATARIVLHSP